MKTIDVTEYELARAVSSLQELLHEEQDHPDSMADGHGRAFELAIEALQDCLEKESSRPRLTVVKEPDGPRDLSKEELYDVAYRACHEYANRAGK